MRAMISEGVYAASIAALAWWVGLPVEHGIALLAVLFALGRIAVALEDDDDA